MESKGNLPIKDTQDVAGSLYANVRMLIGVGETQPKAIQAKGGQYARK